MRRTLLFGVQRVHDVLFLCTLLFGVQRVHEVPTRTGCRLPTPSGASGKNTHVTSSNRQMHVRGTHTYTWRSSNACFIVCCVFQCAGDVRGYIEVRSRNYRLSAPRMRPQSAKTCQIARKPIKNVALGAGKCLFASPARRAARKRTSRRLNRRFWPFPCSSGRIRGGGCKESSPPPHPPAVLPLVCGVTCCCIPPLGLCAPHVARCCGFIRVCVCYLTGFPPARRGVRSRRTQNAERSQVLTPGNVTYRKEARTALLQRSQVLTPAAPKKRKVQKEKSEISL